MKVELQLNAILDSFMRKHKISNITISRRYAPITEKNFSTYTCQLDPSTYIPACRTLNDLGSEIDHHRKIKEG